MKQIFVIILTLLLTSCSIFKKPMENKPYDNNASTVVEDSTTNGAYRVNSDKSPAEVILYTLGEKYPLSGGWGYSPKDAVKILLDNTSEGVGLEYWFIEFRAHIELNGTGNSPQRYGVVNCQTTSQSLQFEKKKPYDVLTYTVKAVPVSELESFSQEWNEHDEYKDDPDGLKNFWDRVEEKAITYQSECWFDISNFFGKL